MLPSPSSSFEYEMVLPDGYGFSNSVALSQSGTNLRSDPRHSLSAAVSSVRRLQTNYMLIVQSSVSSDDSSLEVGIDRICENNLHLKLTPFSMNNFVLGRPKFAVEKAYGQSQFSAITDLGSSSFEFSDSTPGKTSRSLRLFLEPGNLGFIPKIEW